MRVHSRSALIPTCAAVLTAALLAGCAPDPSALVDEREFYRSMVQVRSCVSGDVVFKAPDGSYWVGVPNPIYGRSRLPADLSPERYCQ